MIGAGIRGLEDVQSLLAAGADGAVVCDLYGGQFQRAQEIQANTTTAGDYRQVLDRMVDPLMKGSANSGPLEWSS